MDIFGKIAAQMNAVGLPLFAVTVTAVPRADTPLLLILHWHGFRREAPTGPDRPAPVRAVPGSALQMNDRWQAIETIDAAMLDAGWQLGAWEVEREERRACNWIGASEREALECRQAFGEHPLAGEDLHLVADVPDLADLMELGAAVGYVRWTFRPARGGLWRETADDDTLATDGSRQPPCPIMPQGPRGGRESRTRYRLGRASRLWLP
ncbi:MAG: hypothetical protein KF853_10660 [Rhodocyclaceae bacterium]|nr:hypothetical protein [Rhodocyclaceae bacterium]MBX3677474.1 hypothetical protein [Rhodocyclaceae bacterium]MCO5099008.1 hypothetical protein [Rhodocyclaceae bacterium]